MALPVTLVLAKIITYIKPRINPCSVSRVLFSQLLKFADTQWVTEAGKLWHYKNFASRCTMWPCQSQENHAFVYKMFTHLLHFTFTKYFLCVCRFLQQIVPYKNCFSVAFCVHVITCRFNVQHMICLFILYNLCQELRVISVLLLSSNRAWLYLCTAGASGQIYYDNHIIIRPPLLCAGFTFPKTCSLN